MAYRPYFKHGIEQIQTLVASSRSDLKALKVIQHELKFRDRPQARRLKAEVDYLVRWLSTEISVPPARLVSPSNHQPIFTMPEPPVALPPQTGPDRVSVECAKCKTINFISTLDGVVQHLSCSSCKSPYEAQFKYRVMRTTFQTNSNTNANTEPSGNAIKLVLITLVVLAVVMLLAK